uniref:Transmembrane protein n=1 Tax=Caenorhabditis tropicalis TaxID=1561998 RepID=A0A1I7UQR1_9PELO
MTGEALRERLRSRNADTSLLNTSQSSNRSAFEDKMSPVCKMRHVNNNQRLENLRVATLETRIKWHISLLTVFSIDHVVLSSFVTSTILLFGYFPDEVNSTVSLFIILYSFLMIPLFAFEIKFPNFWQNLFQSTSKPKPVSSVPSTPSAANESHHQLDTSAHSNDLSWVDAHRFGTPTFKSSQILQQSPSPTRVSPQFVNANTSVADVSGILEDSKGGWKTPAAYGKPTESIHTRKQLDVLLRSNKNEEPIDMNASASFNSLWSIFDSGRAGMGNTNNSWQISEEVAEEVNAKCAYRMKIGKNGRTEVKMLRRGKDGEIEDDDDDELTRLHKIMNASKNTPEGKTGILKRSNSIDRAGIRSRRRSHGSPERTSGSEGETRYRTGELLTEEQQKRAEFLTRAWIRNTIILPLAQHIEKVNRLLEKEHANPPLRIGSSSVDALKLAAIERDSLKSSDLPFLLPFLSVHSNQKYIVSRIKELSSSQFMDVYKWNSGGSEPADDSGQTTHLIRREWNDSLPTDAVLIFDIFLAYMDAQLNSNCLVGDNRLDQPFTSRFCVKSPRKPSPAQRSPFSFYLHMVTLSPPHIEFVHIDENSYAVKCNVLRQNPNLFRAIAQFVHYAKHENHGYIDQTSIGPAGINMVSVLA